MGADEDDRLTPLEDPSYVPLHPPVNGCIPETVVRWGRRSQLRWFERFGRVLREQRDKLRMVPSRTRPGWYEREGESQWTPMDEYWCDSEYHKGSCCGSCLGEFEDGFGVCLDGWCCCKQPRDSEDGRAR